ncbi:DUF4381 family protein [Salinimicrobium gaetbulicola]|uniref:DUF4381 family protein n=1 Tax=Salinimicrobium gaetbulicola TaxID=999702 RepID=A0ABW3IH33_9FLAO
MNHHISDKKERIPAQNGRFIFYLLFIFSFLFSLSTEAQKVTSEVDTASIRLGEQIKYRIEVETDSSDLVVFPEGQTFTPLEMVESFPIDTNRIQERFKLIKEYSLTQWDSGSYTIPRQRLVINERPVFTDSVLIQVADVAVDTTKQKMFPIKPSVEVPSGFSVPVWLWWLIGILLIILIGVLFYFRRRRKKAEAAKKLPPYEQAIFELQQLDNSHLLEQREIKEYYSQLSAAVRRYLDGEVYDHAMESTTGELIEYLQQEKETGHLNLSEETILKLRTILERADLAKFAGSRPDVITAREDRSSVEHVIKDTKASIPQPSEEDLLKDQEYKAKLEQKKKVRKIILGVVIFVLLIGAGTAYVISTKGFDYFRDTYFGNESKEMLEGDWIRSEYGSPAVAVTTPQVLTRVINDSVSNNAGKQTFRAGSLASNLYVDLKTRPVGQDFKLESAIEEVYNYLEKNGARNIITKQEDITTLNGAKGLRIFGTMGLEWKNDRLLQKEYTILNFAEGGGYQQIVVIWNEGDTYAEEIANRIMDSVELRNAEN